MPTDGRDSSEMRRSRTLLWPRRSRWRWNRQRHGDSTGPEPGCAEVGGRARGTGLWAREDGDAEAETNHGSPDGSGAAWVPRWLCVRLSNGREAWEEAAEARRRSSQQPSGEEISTEERSFARSAFEISCLTFRLAGGGRSAVATKDGGRGGFVGEAAFGPNRGERSCHQGRDVEAIAEEDAKKWVAGENRDNVAYFCDAFGKRQSEASHTEWKLGGETGTSGETTVHVFDPCSDSRMKVLSSGTSEMRRGAAKNADQRAGTGTASQQLLTQLRVVQSRNVRPDLGDGINAGGKERLAACRKAR